MASEYTPATRGKYFRWGISPSEPTSNAPAALSAAASDIGMGMLSSSLRRGIMNRSSNHHLLFRLPNDGWDCELPTPYSFAGPKPRDHFQLASKAIKKEPSIFVLLSPRLRDNEQLCLMACRIQAEKISKDTAPVGGGFGGGHHHHLHGGQFHGNGQFHATGNGPPFMQLQRLEYSPCKRAWGSRGESPFKYASHRLREDPRMNKLIAEMKAKYPPPPPPPGQLPQHATNNDPQQQLEQPFGSPRQQDFQSVPQSLPSHSRQVSGHSRQFSSHSRRPSDARSHISNFSHYSGASPRFSSVP